MRFVVVSDEISIEEVKYLSSNKSEIVPSQLLPVGQLQDKVDFVLKWRMGVGFVSEVVERELVEIKKGGTFEDEEKVIVVVVEEEDEQTVEEPSENETLYLCEKRDQKR